MKKLSSIIRLVLFALTATVPLYAKATTECKGCVASPENSTAVLGLVLCMACFGFVQFRKRFGASIK